MPPLRGHVVGTSRRGQPGSRTVRTYGQLTRRDDSQGPHGADLHSIRPTMRCIMQLCCTDQGAVCRVTPRLSGIDMQPSLHRSFSPAPAPAHCWSRG